MGNTFQMKLTNTEFIKIVRSTEIRHIRELSLAITSIKISLKSFSREKDLSTSHYGIYIMCGEYVLFFFKENNWVYTVDILSDTEMFLLGLW